VQVAVDELSWEELLVALVPFAQRSLMALDGIEQRAGAVAGRAQLIDVAAVAVERERPVRKVALLAAQRVVQPSERRPDRACLCEARPAWMLARKPLRDLDAAPRAIRRAQLLGREDAGCANGGLREPQRCRLALE
jgi:hypothetical protein